MGGDKGIQVVVLASLDALAIHPRLNLILVGDETQINDELERHKRWASCCDRLSVRHASQAVAMDELASVALRTKKDSSIRVAINLVKAGEVNACVSAGNTGALMATARFVLKTLPGIDRPAIVSELPSRHTKVRILDLGANVDSCAENLFQFAVMGSVLTQAIDNIAAPTVGLLNIGAEEIKGNDQVKRTNQLLAESDIINYIGYVEGNDIYKGVVDVIVCDGFVGNIALKTSEGLAKAIMLYIKEGFEANILTRVVGLAAKPILKAITNRIDPARYNGASFVGLQGIVIKSHGAAGVKAFVYAISEAVREVEKNVPQLIHDKLADLLQEGYIA